jgi:putative addiction module component (TIGR02574 family)
MAHLPRILDHLSAAEKLELLDAIWESLASDKSAITEEKSAELDYREAQYRENPADVLPWEQVKADLLKQFYAAGGMVVDRES